MTDGSKENAFFLHDAKTARVRAGMQVKALEAASKLSRSTIGRIESDAGVSETIAYRYLKVLKELIPGYPHEAPYRRPKNAKERTSSVWRENRSSTTRSDLFQDALLILSPKRRQRPLLRAL